MELNIQRFPSLEHRLEVALKKITGLTGIRKFGHFENVPTTSVPIWDIGVGPYPFQTTALPVRIKAGGHIDDIAGGDGAREVTVIGLGEDFMPVGAIIATNGVDVSDPTSQTFVRVFRSFASPLSVGTYGGKNIGDIDIETTAGVTLARISAGLGQTMMAIYTVPVNKRAVLCQIEASVQATKEAEIKIFKREDADIVSAPFSPTRIISEFHGVLDRVNRTYCVYPEPLPPKTDIWVEGSVSPATGAISAEFDLWLVDA